MDPDQNSAQNDDRGHHAETPEQIPAASWSSILKRIYTSNNQKNLSLLAGGVAFYAMLAIFPALAALVAVYGLLANPAIVQHQINEMRGVIPADAQKLLTTYLTSLAKTGGSKLGLGLIISLAFALWSAREGTTGLMGALNVTYEEQEKRSFVRYEGIGLLMTFAAIAFGIVALLLIAALPAALKLLPFGNEVRTLGWIAPWPVLIVMFVLALAATYRFAPSRTHPRWRWVSWGSILATALCIAGSVGFTFYVAKFGNYEKTFGALGAVVVLLTWLYLCAYAILIGGCMDAEMERQTARDTTIGPEKPMGQRGAKMADTVANDDAPSSPPPVA